MSCRLQTGRWWLCSPAWDGWPCYPRRCLSMGFTPPPRGTQWRSSTRSGRRSRTWNCSHSTRAWSRRSSSLIGSWVTCDRLGRAPEQRLSSDGTALRQSASFLVPRAWRSTSRAPSSIGLHPRPTGGVSDVDGGRDDEGFLGVPLGHWVVGASGQQNTLDPATVRSGPQSDASHPWAAPS